MCGEIKNNENTNYFKLFVIDNTSFNKGENINIKNLLIDSTMTLKD